MGQEDFRSTLHLDGDASGAEKALSSVNKKFEELQQNKALDELAKQAADFAQRTGNTKTALIKLQAELTKIGASDKDVDKVARAFDRNLVQAQKKAEQAAKDLARAEAQAANEAERQANASAKAAEALAESQRFSKDQIGDASTTFGAAGSLVGAFGNNAAAEGLRLGGDLFGLAEYTGRFKDSVANAGKQILEVGGITANTTGALLAGGVAMGSLAIAGVALNAVLGAVEQRYQEQKAAADTLNQALIDSVARQIEASRALEEGNTAAVATQYDEAAKAAEVATAQLETAIAERDAAQKAYDETTGFFRGRDANIDSLNEKIEELETQAYNAQVSLKDFGDVVLGTDYAEQRNKVDDFNAALDQYVGKLDKGTIETLRSAETTEQRTAALARAEELLTQKRDEQIQKIDALAQQQEELTAAYERQAAATVAARELQDDRAAEDAGIAAARKREDLDRQLEEQAAAHEQNMLAIAKRGDDAILAAQKALADKQAQAAAAILDVQAKFEQESQKAQAEFDKQRQRDQRDYLKALQRLEENYRQSRFESILNNDVLGFLQNEGQFRTDKRRTKEDRRDQRRDNREDFDDEQAARAAAAQERIAQIQTELAEFTQATQVKITEIERQTQIELEQAQKAFEDKLEKDQALRDIQNQRDEEDAALRARRQQEDRERQDAAAAAALQANLDKIETRKQAEINALELVGGKAAEVRAAESLLLDNLLTRIQQANTGLAGSTSPITLPPSGSSGYVPTPGSEKFYEDPGQGPAGQSGGGSFGSGFNSVSSAGNAGGSISPVFNFNSVTMGGMEFVLRSEVEESFQALLAMFERRLSYPVDKRG